MGDENNTENSCCNHECGCEPQDTRPKHWSDAVKYVAEAAAFAFMCYCIVKCHG